MLNFRPIFKIHWRLLSREKSGLSQLRLLHQLTTPLWKNLPKQRGKALASSQGRRLRRCAEIANKLSARRNTAMMRERLSEDRKQFLADLAAEVVAGYSATPPIQPEKIARANHLTMSFGHYGDTFDGMLECKAGRFHIFCNLDRVERPESPRGRFTLGHELGHYYIDEHRNALAAGVCPAHPSQCEYKSANLVEQEADFFAGRLLMPERAFRTRAQRSPRGLAGIMPLTETFRTSATSTAIRYAELDLFPCAVIKWNPDGFGWKWLSTETFRARYRKTVERLSDVAEDSATARAIRGELPPQSGFFENGSTAAAWFKWVADDSYRNVIFIEQAVSLGRFGALTFLFPETGAF